MLTPEQLSDGRKVFNGVEVTTSRKTLHFYLCISMTMETAITQKYSKEGAMHIIAPLNIHYVLGCKV